MTGDGGASRVAIPGEEAAEGRLERAVRIGFWGLLVVGWCVAVYQMWEAMTTIPSAERLATSRMVVIPTPRTFFAAVAFSAMELAIVLAALWPWRPAYYASRLAITALVMFTWFVVTTPMQLSRMDWVHRVWLALTILALLVAFVAVLASRLIRRLTRRGEGEVVQ